MKIKIYVILITVLVLSLLASSVLAGLSISPDSVDVQVTKGNNSLPSVNVGNETDKPVDFKIELVGYGQGKDGSTQALDQDSNPLSARSYITFTPAEFHLEPGKKQAIDLFASIPEGANGGRYALLLVITVPSGTDPVNIVSRLGIPIRLTLSNSSLIKKGSVIFTAPEKVAPNNPIPFKVTYVNEGNIHYKVQSTVIVSSVQGNVLAKLYSSTSMVLPGYSRDFIIAWIPDSSIEKGTYNVRVTTSLEDGTILDETSGSFEVAAPYVPPPPPASVTLIPGSSAEMELPDKSISISFPKGAVTGQVDVSLRSYPLTQLPSPPPNYTETANCFRVDGLTGLLAQNATVTVRYSGADLMTAAGDVSRLKLARWDEATNAWTVLKTKADKSAMTLTAQTNQFSIWAVMVSSPAKTNWLLIGGAIAAGIIIIAALVAVLTRKKKVRQ